MSKVSLTPYPVGPQGNEATPVVGSANGTTGAVTATLAAYVAPAAGSLGPAHKRTYITGFEATFTNPTAAIVVTVTVATLIGAVSMVYTVAALAAGATIPHPPPLVVQFPKPIPANADDTAITVVVSALGAGATGVSVNAHGFQA
jgi:hypothetical protein